MLKIYSHSRLSVFEQCPFKFKLKYIDKIAPELGQTIESYLGNAVHETLEWLYTCVIKNSIPTITNIIEKYTEIWEKKFTPDIRIIKKNLTLNYYFSKGVKFLIDYYMKYKPFDDGTIETEKKITIDLDDSEGYKVQGFIDRLVKNQKTGEYEIHDYKTANTLPTKEKIESDRQLALYSLGLKKILNLNSSVTLVWHYLAHNIKIISRRTDTQLETLRKEIIELIKKIESTKEFPTYTSILCDWCEYKSMCPAFGGHVKKKTIQAQLPSTPEQELEEEIKEESVKPEGLDIW